MINTKDATINGLYGSKLVISDETPTGVVQIDATDHDGNIAKIQVSNLELMNMALSILSKIEISR